MHAHDGFRAASRAATSEERKRAAKIGLSAGRFSKPARSSKPRHQFLGASFPLQLASPLPSTKGQRLRLPL
jgi:hypothetical protein